MTKAIELHGVEPITHDTNGGFGALATIFNFYDEPIMNAERFSALDDLAEENGFAIEEIAPTIGTVKDVLSQGTPVLVRYSDNKELKYGILVGFDEESVKLLDAQAGKTKWLNTGDFEAKWENYAATVTPAAEDFKKSHSLNVAVKELTKSQ